MVAAVKSLDVASGAAAGVTALLPLEEIRSDVGLFLDRVVVAIDAVRYQRVIRNHGVFVELDRIQPDDSGVFSVVPFERRRTMRAFTCSNRFCKNIAFDHGFRGT